MFQLINHVDLTDRDKSSSLLCVKRRNRRTRMSGILFRFLSCVIHIAELGRYQHGGKIRLNQERTVK